MSPGCHPRPAILRTRRPPDIPLEAGSSEHAMRVLIVEDDDVLAMAVAAGLRREGMAVDVALEAP